MDNVKLNKGILLLGFILTPISLLLSVLLQWITDKHFLWLQSIISYKWMLIILLIIILLLTYALVYKKIFIVERNNNKIEKICPNCSKPKLKVIRSTVRSFIYKCSSYGFDHRVLKEGQTNVSRA